MGGARDVAKGLIMKLFPALLALSLTACGGLPKPTGNEAGGVINWFGTNQEDVFRAATAHCAQYGKKARIRDIRAQAGGHAFFDCI